MVTLAQDNKGNYRARKRLPDDVREDYGRLYGPRYEDKFYEPASTKLHVAKQLFNEWSAEVEGRIEAIRAERKGDGVSLTRQQTRALAGEWYDWYVARHPTSDLQKWEDLREHVYEALREAVGDDEWERNNPDDLWRDGEELRKRVRPVLADIGETAQFLGMKRLALDGETKGRFLDYLYDDLAAVFQRLIGIAQGDYSPDKYRERFPKFEGTDTGDTPQQLFARWVSERKPQASTIETWGYVFSRMSQRFAGRSAASVTSGEAQEWLRSLVTEERSARTVRNTDLRASKAIFNWAVEHKYVPKNPFSDAKITVPKKTTNRDTKAFSRAELQTILKGALAINDTRRPFGAAQRWVPWLLAYTGARPSEITQLRKQDVIERDGIHALLFAPDAGSIKSGKARAVPLHADLIDQGFLGFVKFHRDGPLFYEPDTKAKKRDQAKVKKPRSAQVRQRLANWIRSLGVIDGEVSPNHGWRHTFKQIADRGGISERMSDSITGHAHKSVGAAYGGPTLEDKAEAMKKFPRYVIE